MISRNEYEIIEKCKKYGVDTIIKNNSAATISIIYETFKEHKKYLEEQELPALTKAGMPTDDTKEDIRIMDEYISKYEARMQKMEEIINRGNADAESEVS